MKKLIRSCAIGCLLSLPLTIDAAIVTNTSLEKPVDDVVFSINGDATYPTGRRWRFTDSTTTDIRQIGQSFYAGGAFSLTQVVFRVAVGDGGSALMVDGEVAFRVRNSQGAVLINGLEVFGASGAKPLRVQWESVEVEETSAWQIRRALHGVLLDPKGQQLARMHFAVNLYADVPYVQTRLTMTSQAPGGLELERYGYRFRTTGTADSRYAREGWVSGAGAAGSWVAVVKSFKHL